MLELAWLLFGLLRHAWTRLGWLGLASVCSSLPCFLGLFGFAWAPLGLLGLAWDCLGLLGFAWVRLGSLVCVYVCVCVLQLAGA